MHSILETDADIQAGLARLLEIDPRLAAAAARCGALPLRRRAAGYEGLAAIIVGQQVSTASASAIWTRFAARFAPFDPVQILTASDEDMRGCGLSLPKIKGLRAAAAVVADGTLPLEDLARMPVDEARSALLAVPGIGPWTADVYLMFCIGHADIFAAGDLALQEGARLVLGLPDRPDARALSAIALAWQPWRAVAARLLWRYYALAKQRDATPAPA